MATKDPLTHIGAQNLAHTTADFFQEDITYIHYSKPIYHQLANDLAASIASRWKAGEEMDEGEVVIPPEDFAYLAAFSNSWGDVVFLINPKEAAPAGHTYEVLILDGSSIKRTLTASTAKTHADGRLYVDYPVELSIPDWGFPPTFLSWTLRVDGEIQGGLSGAPSLNNAAIVKKVVGIAGQSNALGHFTTLSGTGGRRDLVSAGALRRDLATRLGLRAVEVIPLEIAWGSAAAEKLADDDPATGTNHWWNLDDNIAGPRLVEALAKIASLGVPLSYLIWAQGENDGSAIYNQIAGDPQDTGRVSTPERYKSATTAIFAALRTASDDADLPIYLQPVMRAFWSTDGADPDPGEIAGEAYGLVRQKQIEIAEEDPGVFVGTWVPGADQVSGYNPDTDGTQWQWVHFTSAVYHTAALEIAEAISTPLDRINDAPAWINAEPPVLTVALYGNDEVVTWPGEDGDTYTVINLNVQDNTVISTRTITVVDGRGTWTFTQAEQEAEYGTGMYPVTAYVTVYQNLDGGSPGPSAVAIIRPDELENEISAPTGLAARYAASGGWDIEVTWAADEDDQYQVTSRSIETGAVITTGTVTGGKWVFTGAQQVAAYGYHVAHVDVEVSQTLNGYTGTPTRQILSARTEQEMDGSQPVLWADFVRGQYTLNSNEATANWLFTRSGGTKFVKQADGAWGWAPANSLAFDYSSGRRRLVLEGAATNLVKHSSDLLNAAWVRVSSILSAAVSSVPSPTGALNAFVFDCAVNTAGAIYQSVAVTPGSTVTLSVWVRMGTLPASEFKLGFYDDTAAAWINNNIAPAVAPNATTWTRCSATIVVPAGCTSLRVYPLRENSTTLGGTVHLFGPQIEIGAIATSYIETGAAAVTRVADVAPWSTAVGVMPQSGCTLVLRGSVRTVMSSQIILRNNLGPFLASQNGNPALMSFTPPGGAATAKTESYLPGNIGVALAWGSAGAAWAVNNGSISSNSTSATAAITDLWIGNNSGLQPGMRFELDELVIWPVKGSASAIQAQARVWA